MIKSPVRTLYSNVVVVRGKDGHPRLCVDCTVLDTQTHYDSCRILKLPRMPPGGTSGFVPLSSTVVVIMWLCLRETETRLSSTPDVEHFCDFYAALEWTTTTLDKDR